MTYIGTPRSRIDGHAKVTGAAKYAADLFKGLAYGAVVASTIAKGRITRIDAGDALPHQRRPLYSDAWKSAADGARRRRL